MLNPSASSLGSQVLSPTQKHLLQTLLNFLPHYLLRQSVMVCVAITFLFTFSFSTAVVLTGSCLLIPVGQMMKWNRLTC